MFKSRLEIMENLHDQMIGAIIGAECEIDILTPKTIIITNAKESAFIKQMIDSKKHGIESMGETIAILEDKIEVEKKKK
jgi:hypothetical protein